VCPRPKLADREWLNPPIKKEGAFPNALMIINSSFVHLLAGCFVSIHPSRIDLPVSYSPDPAFSSVDYTSANVQSHTLQRFALYLPDTAMPANGYPAVIHVSNISLRKTDYNYDTDLDSAPMSQFLDAGFAVIRAALTFSRFNTVNFVCPAVGPNQICPPEGPPGPIPGNGLFHQPGLQLPGLGQAPYTDVTRPYAEKDVIQLVQHVRFNASAMGLDSSRIGVYGRSGGASIAMWIALGPERKDDLFGPGTTGQDSISTRVDAAILRNGVMYVPALVLATSEGTHWPDSSGAPNWTTPSGFLSASNFGSLVTASPLNYQDPLDPFTVTMNKVYMTYKFPPESINFSAPYITNTLTNGHASWGGYAWQELYPNNTELVLTSASAKADLNPAGPVPIYANYHDLIEDEGSLLVDEIEYLIEELDVWQIITYKGGGVPALDGISLTTPVFLASGDFTAASPGRIGLSEALPGAKTLLFVGFSTTSSGTGIPTLKPASTKTVDAGGRIEISGIDLSATTQPFDAFVQFGIADPSSPNGIFTASNIIKISVQ
jgi:hypothetical protein